MEAQDGEEVKLLLVYDLGTTWGWVVSVTPRPPLSLGKGHPVPIVQEAGWTPDPVWTQRLEEKFLLPLPGIEPRSPNRPVRRQTLYWLSYPDSYKLNITWSSELSSGMYCRVK
jgi:hypothetical protein